MSNDLEYNIEHQTLELLQFEVTAAKSLKKYSCQYLGPREISNWNN